MPAANRRPPAPGPAERAKSISVRGGPATLAAHGRAGGDPTTPLLHTVHPNGSVSVLLAADHPLVTAASTAEDGDLAVLLELTDIAPIELRERTRALLWITGWLRLLTPQVARARALMIAETEPRSELLDVGHDARMLCLHPSSLVLADADGTHALRPHEFTTASADPFSKHERKWLKHLESHHTDVVDLLARHLPEHLRAGRIRPLGLDRFGLRLRVEAPEGDHDVRLAFGAPVHTEAEFAAQLRTLVGCPFLANARRTAS